MEFEPLRIAGAFRIRLERRDDARGFFARTFCSDEFARAGLPVAFPQQSLARSQRAGTLRGLHLQLEPHAEDKHVRCVRGRIFDAFVDLRPASPTFLLTESVVLDADAGDAIFVPRGCAHGYQTLADATDVLYAMSSIYAPAAARSLAWNDPQLAIAWPLADPILSDADRAAPGLAALLAEITPAT
jgi:dTDP-4-dehydrorhamnose 3,5-epimerase